MPTRTTQKAETRDRILTVAKNLFETEGFEATSIRRIADTAGVATGTVLFHFADKADLLHTALFEDLEGVLRTVAGAPPGRSLARWLSRLVDQVLAHYEARPALSRVLLRESIITASPWAQRFAAQVARLHGAVAARAAIAVTRGELNDRFEPPLFAAAFVSYYLFGLVAWAQGSHPDPRALVDHMVDHHLAGYRRTEPRA